MRLTQDHPDFETTAVLLNGKLCKSVLEADDEEGWVDVPDLAAMTSAPEQIEGKGYGFKDTSKVEDGTSVEPWEEIPILRKKGRVQFISMKKPGI